MKKFIQKAVVLAVAFALLCAVALFAACDDKTPPEPTATYTVEGVVSNDMGLLSGVTVTLGSETKTTGTSGSYSFTVTEGTHTLTFAKSGFTTVQKSVDTADAVDGTVKCNVTMTVQQKEYFTISGVVSDADGVLAGVTVSGDALDTPVTTDAEGKYTLPQLEKTGEYALTFSKSGYVAKVETVAASGVSGAAHTLNVTLEKIPEEEVATVSGTVRADIPEGPIAGVTVKIGSTTVTTGTDGTYSLLTSREACTVEFSKAGFDTKTVDLTAEDLADGAQTVDASIVRSTVLAGKTNAKLLAEVESMKEVPVISSCGKTAIEQCWNAGGAAGSEYDVIEQGYRMTSNGDNDNDEYRRYIYGKLAVTENNDTLTLYGRTFGVETEFAVKVIDPATLDSAFVKATGSDTVWAAHIGDDYGKYTFDLSDYDGETVIVAVGVRKAALTVESIFLTADGTFAFGRTSAAALENLQPTAIASGTRYTATAEPMIQDTFVTVGTAKVDNNRWMLTDARGGQAEDAQPHSYVFGKTTITAANARMSIRWSSYNNKPIAASTKVLAWDASNNSVIHMYTAGTSDTNEWNEVGFDLSECLGKEVVLAIGMSYGNRMGIDWIRFDRMSYTLTGTVTLPEEGGYNLSQVSFKLDNEPLTAGQNDFTFDTTTGVYTLKLDAKKTTGNLTVAYNNAGLDADKQLLPTPIDLSALTVDDTVTKNVALQQNSNQAAPVNVTVKIGNTALDSTQAQSVTVKIGENALNYGDGKWSNNTLTMADATAVGTKLTVTFTANSKFANIYETKEIQLTTSDYNEGKADIAIDLTERDILPGLKFSQMQNAPELVYDHYQGWRAHNVFRSFAKSNPIRSEEQNEGDTIRVIEGSQKNETEFNGYVYGVKTVTETSNTMIINMRTHNDDNTVFGVMVVDLTTGARVTVGDIRKQNSRDYRDHTFDLSAFVDKKVLIATGIFYTSECGNVDMQYVIGHIRFHAFGSTWAESVDKIAGTALTDSAVAVQTKTDFLGSSNDRDRDNYIFKTWGTAIESESSADYEFGPSEGALIKTRNGSSETDNRVFLYNKFAITTEHNYLRFNARTFNGSVDTGVAVTVYYKNESNEVVSEVMAVDLANCTYPDGGKVAKDGESEWLRVNDGNKDYIHLKWDLSKFDGKEVVVMIGLRNTWQGGNHESKLAIQEIHLEAKPA